MGDHFRRKIHDWTEDLRHLLPAKSPLWFRLGEEGMEDVFDNDSLLFYA